MKQSEIIKLSLEDLNENYVTFKKNLTDLKMTHAISPLESPMELRKLRKNVARLATELTKRELQ
ncbi:MAG TPA: 50S ribosomal protein L29 [Flavobacteriaceae bacterium]|nr:50S ribosomal protein L29 [Flavobacteriaceae bacterium]HIP27364.1 50S ribosomal protein L29 [Flavobacteriaceae bacterium]